MEKTLHYLLMASHLTFQKALLTEIRDMGLTSGQTKVLDYLWNHDGAVQKEIASACCIEAATLTSVLLGMENKGLIVRKMQDGNRRSLYVFLTEKGRAAAKRVESGFAAMEGRAVAGFSHAEKELLTALLARVEKNIRYAEVCNGES